MPTEYVRAFNCLKSHVPDRVEVECLGSEIRFELDGPCPIDQVEYSLDDGRAYAYRWKREGKSFKTRLYFGPWQNEEGNSRGNYYVAICLLDSLPTTELNVEARLRPDRILLYPFTFSSRDGLNQRRKEEALALAEERYMEVLGDKLILGRWDQQQGDFVEGTREVYKRFFWAALVKDKLRKDNDFHHFRVSETADGHTDSDKQDELRHSASQELKPATPKADEMYLTKVGTDLKYRSRSHMSLLNELADFVKQLGLTPKDNKAIDLATQTDKGTVVFEVKVLPNDNPLPGLRIAIGQLYEYRYWGAVPKDSLLCIVLPSKPEADIIDYLERDRGIGVLWKDGKRFGESAWAKHQLKLRGYGDM